MGLPLIVFYILAYSKIVPMTIGIVNRNYLDKRATKMYIFYIVSLVIEILALLIAYYRGNNLFITHVGKFTEVILLFLVLVVPSKFERRRSLYIGGLILVIAGFVAELTLRSKSLNTLDFINSYGAAGGAVFLTVLALISLFDLRNDPKVLNLGDSPMFFISIGILLYYSTGILIFAFSQTVLEASQISAGNIFFAHLIVYALMSVLCSIGFWRSKSRQVRLSTAHSDNSQ